MDAASAVAALTELVRQHLSHFERTLLKGSLYAANCCKICGLDCDLLAENSTALKRSSTMLPATRHREPGLPLWPVAFIASQPAFASSVSKVSAICARGRPWLLPPLL